jgi:hypothetical protein
MKDAEKWYLQFEAIDDLRRINKFHHEQMLQITPYFSHFIFCSVDNLRSGISKNSLMMLNEFFKSAHTCDEDRDKAMKSLIEVVMPTVLHKTIYDLVFINKEAKEVLNNALN